MNRTINIKTVFIIFQLLAAWISISSHGQVYFRPINDASGEDNRHLRIQADERDSTQLKVPFWDDFSRTSQLPDTAHWFVDIGSSNVTSSLGINAPTVNVASFDGWNTQGTPYSSEQLQEGAGDSLVSRFIDLSAINPSLRETMYLSFFWQKEGRGEVPDDPDSIRLQGMNMDKKWVTLWSKTGAEASTTDRFFQESILINDASFYHPYFQFRFQAFGRLSGGFDTWNIDYVFLNINRNAGDLFFEDRALNSEPTSWLTTYSAMPYDHFIINLQGNLQPTSVGVSNLDDQVQPIEYFALIQDTAKVFDEMNSGTPLNLAPNSIASIRSEPIDPDAFDVDADSISLILETKFFINSGDSANWFNKYDLRSNDTTTRVIKLDKELAYDDGTAEWAAGLAQKSGMLAYRYVIPKNDAITEVKIYFPDFVPSAAGKTFDIIIWDDLFQYREGRLLTEQHIVQKSTTLNEFTTYALGRPVAVSDTFYIGYEQSVDDFFPVGLDKFGPSAQGNIFINLDGVWEPSNIIEGNLMIRPVFGFEKAVGLEEELFQGIVLFPNPNKGVFSIRGQFEQGRIFDLMGNLLLVFRGRDQLKEVKLPDARKGLYLLKLTKEGKEKTLKFMVN